MDCFIQGDSGGKVNILGWDSIGHCEKKNVYMSMCPIVSVHRARAVRIYNYTIIANGNKES